MIETIYLVRHGFRLNNDLLARAPTDTPLDYVLSASGIEGARECATFFAALQSEKPDRIFSSPFYRCLQTATPLADRLDLPILIEHGLSEFYLSVQQGRHPRAKSASVLQQWFPRIDPLAHDSLVYPNQKGETILEVHSRAEVTLRKLITITEARDPHVRHVIIFTHAATNIAMGRALTADSTLSIRSGTCSVGKYKRNASVPNVRDGLGQWTQTLNGDTSFLKAGEERHWEFSYIEEYEDIGILPDEGEEVLSVIKSIAKL